MFIILMIIIAVLLFIIAIPTLADFEREVGFGELFGSLFSLIFAIVGSLLGLAAVLFLPVAIFTLLLN